MNALFSLESILEGAPLMLLAGVFLHKADLSRCWHMNCDPAVLRASFPASVLPGFNSTEMFTEEYAAAMQTHPGCIHQPVSSDNWFTAHTELRPGEFLDWHVFGRPMAFRLDGAPSYVYSSPDLTPADQTSDLRPRYRI